MDSECRLRPQPPALSLGFQKRRHTQYLCQGVSKATVQTAVLFAIICSSNVALCNNHL